MNYKRQYLPHELLVDRANGKNRHQARVNFYT